MLKTDQIVTTVIGGLAVWFIVGWLKDKDLFGGGEATPAAVPAVDVDTETETTTV